MKYHKMLYKIWHESYLSRDLRKTNCSVINSHSGDSKNHTEPIIMLTSISIGGICYNMTYIITYTLLHYFLSLPQLELKSL